MEYLFWWRQLFPQSLIILWHQAFWQLTTIPPPKDRKYLSAEEYFSLRSFKGHIAWFALRGCFWKGGEKKRFELEDVHLVTKLDPSWAPSVCEWQLLTFENYCSRRGCRRELNCSRTLSRGLQSPSFFGAGIDRWAWEKSHSITPPAVPISHLCFWIDVAALQAWSWINNEESQ